MWRCDLLKSSLNEYINSEFIDDIIIIDNEPTKKFDLPKNNKIKYLTKGYNIFVNPAWNWGVSESKNENLIIANDDILIQNIDYYLENFLLYENSIIGLSSSKLNSTDIITIEDSVGNMPKGFGCFFYLRKKNYIPIPEDLKIFYGDVILYNSTIEKKVFYGPNIEIKMSVTSNSFLNFFREKEKPTYKSKYEKIYTLKWK